MAREQAAEFGVAVGPEQIPADVRARAYYIARWYDKPVSIFCKTDNGCSMGCGEPAEWTLCDWMPGVLKVATVFPVLYPAVEGAA